MFTFHKPKVFRSTNGCCICKAKSSSSRFTDSGKYETVFMKCFHLDQMRSGEICNACVLLVKRFLKLPKDSKKNWNHVVDARSGPGIKSVVKNKNKLNKMRIESEESTSLNSSITDSPDKIKKKHVYKPKNKRKMEKSTIRQRDPTEQFSDFLDDTLWRRKSICCGYIFIGPFGEVALDMKYYKPCKGCKKDNTSPKPAEIEAPTSPKPAEIEEEVPMECSEKFSHLESSNKLSAVCAAAAVLDEESGNTNISLAASVSSGDFDEGFFDKPAISPSSEGSATPPPNEATLEEDDEAESLQGLDLANKPLNTIRTPLLASN